MRTTGKRARGLRRPALTAAALLAVLAAFMLACTAECQAATKPAKPTAKTPKGTISVMAPTFKWGKAKRATRYELRVYSGAKALVKKAGIKGTKWTATAALPANTALSWKVRGRGAAGYGPWSKSLSFTIALAIGQSYGGGRIAYILQPGDTGYVAGETHGIIAATADRTPAMYWSNIQTGLAGASGTAVGTGQQNTAAIVAQSGCSGGAAYVCDRLVENGYEDWYLPSKDELNQLYINRWAIGGFGTEAYWTSSEGGSTHAWSQMFVGGNQAPYSLKSYPFWVRPVRSF